MDKQSKPYTDNFFEEIFNASSMASLAAEDVVPYSQSLQRLKDDQVALEYTAKKAREEGREEGRKEGILHTAREMLKIGLSPDVIRRVTGLSLSVIATLVQ